MSPFSIIVAPLSVVGRTHVSNFLREFGDLLLRYGHQTDTQGELLPIGETQSVQAEVLGTQGQD